MNQSSKILLVGHNDILENSLFQYFQANAFKNVISSSAVNLNVFSQAEVQSFFEKHKPEYVFLGSTRSGGIEANVARGAEFMYCNLESQNNIIHSSYKHGVKKLLYFAGSCIYPKECPQPMKPEHLMTGHLEVTSEPYSVAKIAGVKLCGAYKKYFGLNAITAVPATVYGPGSDAVIETAHVIGALIGKFFKAVASGSAEVDIWGSGEPRREFLFVDDFVAGCLHVMEHYNGIEMVNMGCGHDVSIRELAEMVKEVSGFAGKIIFDKTHPDGTLKKLMDSTVIKQTGWLPKVDLRQGIEKTYRWYCEKSRK